MRADLGRLLARPIAHRGLHACGGRGPVENSMAAAEAAIVTGYGIECDVQLSRDREAMVFHDADLTRLTGAAGRIAETDAAALRRMTLGHSGDHIPDLTEFLAAIDGRAPLVIEIKSSSSKDMGLTERVAACIERYAGPVALESFDPGVVLHCRRLAIDRPIGLVGPAEDGAEADPSVLAACDFLSWSIGALAAVAERYPSLPRTSWTIRTAAQAALAVGHNAQIVFEGFTPSPR